MTAIDLVYPIGSGCEWGDFEELKYSIRSACKYVQGLRHVYIVGTCPKWAKGVIHIPYGDPHRHNKDANLIDKVRLACAQPQLSEQFIRLSDDQYFLRPWLLAEHQNPLAYGNLVSDGILWKRAPAKYQDKITRTCDTLLKLGKGTWFYDTHVPAVYHKGRFAAAIGSIDYASKAFTINTLCLNLTGAVPCGRDMWSLRCELTKPLTAHQVAEKCAGKYYLNHTPEGIGSGLKQFLKEQFPEKSRFEI